MRFTLLSFLLLLANNRAHAFPKQQHWRVGRLSKECVVNGGAIPRQRPNRMVELTLTAPFRQDGNPSSSSSGADTLQYQSKTQSNKSILRSMFATTCCCCCLLLLVGAPRLAHAAPLDTSRVQQQQQPCRTIYHKNQPCIIMAPSSMKNPTLLLFRDGTHKNSLLVAASTPYASQGAGGLPFLSPFTAPGATPKATDPKVDDRATRNRAFDEAFDQDKRERDAYYAKMAIQSRETKMQQLKEQRQSLGLDLDDSGPRFGDEQVASMASLKKFLLEQDPSTMTAAELREAQQLQSVGGGGGGGEAK